MKQETWQILIGKGRRAVLKWTIQKLVIKIPTVSNWLVTEFSVMLLWWWWWG
jgi:hypothetical protein